MIRYKPGDVVFCKFPKREDNLEFTKRPALVMKVINDGDSYMMAQITHTDRSTTCHGKWVLEFSKEGRQMKLRGDSFINLSNILEVDDFAIERFLGTCPIFKDLENICQKEGIRY